MLGRGCGLLTDLSVQQPLKGVCEGLLTLPEVGAVQAGEDLANLEALLVRREAEETGPGRGIEDREGRQGGQDGAPRGQPGHGRGSQPGGEAGDFCEVTVVRGRGSRCRGQRSGLSHQSNVRLPHPVGVFREQGDRGSGRQAPGWWLGRTPGSQEPHL